MELTPEQRSQVASWIADGAKLADVQRRLEADFQLRMTYMDVRFLIDDLAIDLPDQPTAQPTPMVDATPPAAPGQVSVSIDKITRPSALASGSVTFSDGKKATWLLDQYGRLGLDGVSKDYRPSNEDMESFQQKLSEAARSMGL